ncbi:MAG: phage portal protein [Alphaproteobacteria bacterium]|nr:phage portal protein [Alphaproteobacteria bacterium]
MSADEQLNGLDFDRQVIFNYLIDGEVFIRKVKDSKSKFGIRYEIIDSLDVDLLYNCDYMQDGTKITMGIKTDEHNKPLSYFIRKNKSADYYLSGERIEVKAD